jgi:protein gp37
MNKTTISWTTVTWNPTHGCSRVSDGCRHCYAETLSLRRGWTTKPWTGPNAVDNVLLKPHKLKDPYALKEPSRIFVNSMSDLFHELIPDDYIAKVFQVMNELPQHVFQILTKRPKRAATWQGVWAPNIWMGTSIEDDRVLERLDQLRPCQADILFVSFEPLIGPIGSNVDLTGFHWAVVGGESGTGYRPMPHAWAREIRDACLEQDVSFFFKQSAAPKNEMGAALLHEDGCFYRWRQWPDEMHQPIRDTPHRFTYESKATS